MRPWVVVATFGSALAVVLAALGWICNVALELDRAETEVRRQADFEEGVRLALWRMESMLTPLITQESGRPYFSYSAFYAPERAYTSLFEELDPEQLLVPSTLLKLDTREVLVHFQVDPAGQWSSPQLPTSNMRDLAESRGFTTPERLERARRQLEALRSRVDLAALGARVPEPELEAADPALETCSVLPEAPPLATVPESLGAEDPGSGAVVGAADGAARRSSRRGSYREQPLRNGNEWLARNFVGCSTEINRVAQGLQPSFVENVSEGVMVPLWADGHLLLARRVRLEGQSYLQGCLLDWAHIKESLLASSVELLPNADLQPGELTMGIPDHRHLASLPVRLDPGQVAEEEFGSEVRFSILMAWTGVLVAALAVSLLLVGAVAMSERRRRFVSAVTHELRTPLTTFRMYTEMLKEGMVPTPEKQREYLNRLHAEGERLGHLVENVLAFARLEGTARGSQRETVTVGELWDRIRGRLEDRAELAALALEVVPPREDCRGVTLRVDAGAVERVLFNLVDNACKYGRSAAGHPVTLSCSHSGSELGITVRDRGPGIARQQQRRLFQAFRSAGETCERKEPGVGLGLALSRRLARDMGGDLRLDKTVDDGAAFTLSLPVERS